MYGDMAWNGIRVYLYCLQRPAMIRAGVCEVVKVYIFQYRSTCVFPVLPRMLTIYRIHGDTSLAATLSPCNRIMQGFWLRPGYLLSLCRCHASLPFVMR